MVCMADFDEEEDLTSKANNHISGKSGYTEGALTPCRLLWEVKPDASGSRDGRATPSGC